MANDILNSRQNKAYEFYRSLPPEERTYARVAEEFGVSNAAVHRWKTQGNWDQRIKESMERVTDEIERYIEKCEVQGSKLYLKFIDEAIEQAIKRVKSGELKLTAQELLEFMRFGVEVRAGLATIRAEVDIDEPSDKMIKRSFVGGDTDGEK